MKFRAGLESLSVVHLHLVVGISIVLIMLVSGLVVIKQSEEAFSFRLENYHYLQTDKLIQLRQELNFQAEIVLKMIKQDSVVNDLVQKLTSGSRLAADESHQVVQQLHRVLSEFEPKTEHFAVTAIEFVQPDEVEMVAGNHADAADITTGLVLKADGLGLTSLMPLYVDNQLKGGLAVTLGLQQVARIRHARSAMSKNKLGNLFAQSAILVLNNRLNLLNEPLDSSWFRGRYWSTLHPNTMLHSWMQSEQYFTDTRSQFELVQYDGRYYLLSTLPWRWLKQQDKDPVFSISVQWQDVTDNVTAYTKEKQFSILTLMFTTLVLVILGITVVRLLLQLAKKSVERQQLLLHESEQKFTALYQLSPLPMVLNRFEDAGYVAANPAMEQLVGYSLAELTQFGLLDLTPDCYAQADKEQLELLGINGFYGPYIKQYRHKNGELIDVELNGVLFTDFSGEKFIWTIIKDIREIKRVEKLKDDFVATVSHELRTPLTSISGSLGLVLGGASGQLNAKSEKLLMIAHKNSQRLNVLINDLLDIEKLMAGKMRFNEGGVSLSRLLPEAIEQQQPYAMQQKVILTLLDVPDIQIWADSARIQQVLANFLSNAIKFSPEGGVVALGAKRIHEKVQIFVKDQGQGIALQDQRKLFKRFSQLSNNNQSIAGGTGLGLAISREIILQSGGEVGVESEQGQGATFWLTLPVYEAQRKHEVHEPVLVIEDDHDTALLLCEFLSLHGYSADWAPDSTSAWRMLSENNYVAITLDLMLQAENGADFFLKLRDNIETANIPVLIVSAFVEQGKLQLAALSNALDWIEKPVNHELLALKLGQLLSHLPTKNKYHRILHIEDDADIVTIMQLQLDGLCEYQAASSLAEANLALTKHSFDLVLLDLGLPDGNGISLLPAITQTQGDIPVVIFSAQDLRLDDKEKVHAMFSKSQINTDVLAKYLKKILD